MLCGVVLGVWGTVVGVVVVWRRGLWGDGVVIGVGVMIIIMMRDRYGG